MVDPADSLTEVDVEVVDEVVVDEGVAAGPVEEGACGVDLRASSYGVVHEEGGNEGEGDPSLEGDQVEGAFHLKTT